jgi:hypothetical protein
MGVKRSFDKAYRAHKGSCEGVQIGDRTRAPNHWAQTASRWGWVQRAELWDAAADKEQRERAAKDQTEARLRHARLAQGALTALTVPVRATIDAITDPAVLQNLVARSRTDPSALLAVIGVVARVANTIPGLVNVERLALGMTTERVEVDERRETSLAVRIAEDPAAADLAIALLDRVAGTGPGTPVGPGAPGERRGVADSAPPQPPHP